MWVANRECGRSYAVPEILVHTWWDSQLPFPVSWNTCPWSTKSNSPEAIRLEWPCAGAPVGNPRWAWPSSHHHQGPDMEVKLFCTLQSSPSTAAYHGGFSSQLCRVKESPSQGLTELLTHKSTRYHNAVYVFTTKFWGSVFYSNWSLEHRIP